MFNFKRFIALGVVSTMVLGSSLTAFASDLTSGTATSGVTGDGVNEGGNVDTDVYKVQVPTDAAIKATVWYTIDKVGWIKETNAARYASEMADGFEIDDSSNLLFKNLNDAGKVAKMSNTSDALKITNVGTMPVDLVISGEFGTVTGDAVTSGATSIDAVEAAKALYLEMFTNDVEKKSLSGTAATITTAGKSSQDLYKIGWDSENTTYTYAIPAADAGKASSVDVYFRGAFSKDGATTKTTGTGADATTTALATPGIKLIFTATKPEATVKSAYAVWEGTSLWIGADAENGLPDTEKDVSAIKVDGKTLSISSVKSGKDGWVELTWEDIYKKYGFTEEPEDWAPQVVQITINSKTYIADIH